MRNFYVNIEYVILAHFYAYGHIFIEKKILKNSFEYTLRFMDQCSIFHPLRQSAEIPNCPPCLLVLLEDVK